LLTLFNGNFKIGGYRFPGNFFFIELLVEKPL
jgi:hypothetical protein